MASSFCESIASLTATSGRHTSPSLVAVHCPMGCHVFEPSLLLAHSFSLYLLTRFAKWKIERAEVVTHFWVFSLI